MNLNKENDNFSAGISEAFSKRKQNEHKKENVVLFDTMFCVQDYAEKPMYNAGKSLLEKYSSILHNYPLRQKRSLFFLQKNMFFNKKKDASTLYWGRINQFIDVEIVISKQTQDIIEECVHYIEPAPLVKKRQQIHSLPQLCKYYKLTYNEIVSLCYILYDCKSSILDDSFRKQSIMSRARHLCKDHRYLLHLTPDRYGKMLQQILLVDTKLSVQEITIWLNSISRIYHLIIALLCFDTSEENIFLALYNIPRKVICSAAEGCIIDKSIVNTLKLLQPKDLKQVQEIIIISEAIKIIQHKMRDEKIFDPRVLLETIDPKEYMRTTNPVFSLIKKFNDIDQKASSLVRIPSVFLQYIMNETKPITYTQEYFESIECLAYTLKRIMSQNNIDASNTTEGYAIIEYLLSLPEELTVFYGIHPQEYEKKYSHYHVAILPALAYIQYNKEHDVYPHALSLMKYIPLESYIHDEKSHESVQKHYENIIEHYPMLLAFPERKLTKLLKIRLDYMVVNNSPYQLFEDVENIIEALKRIEDSRKTSFLSQEEYMWYLSTISIDNIKFIRSFPEIVGLPFFKKLPIELLNIIYTSFLQERRVHGGRYDSTLIQYISPLELLPSEYNEIINVQEKEIAHLLRTKLEEMSVLFIGKQYEVNDLSIALDTIKSCYYSTLLSKDIRMSLLEHSQLVLEVYYREKDSNLRELCKKPKNILERYRKEEE
ncbi:MAG: hypothetical protein ACRCV3_05525 [Desulfovibrionaceae bacterium]